MKTPIAVAAFVLLGTPTFAISKNQILIVTMNDLSAKPRFPAGLPPATLSRIGGASLFSSPTAPINPALQAPGLSPETLAKLKAGLEKKIVGQDEHITRIAGRIRETRSARPSARVRQTSAQTAPAVSYHADPAQFEDAVADAIRRSRYHVKIPFVFMRRSSKIADAITGNRSAMTTMTGVTSEIVKAQKPNEYWFHHENGAEVLVLPPPIPIETVKLLN